jgi:hypothetical protein
MITAIVRYKLPKTIGKEECRAHYEQIARGFADAEGLIRKQFIWSESGTAGGVYQWDTLENAKRFYNGPWLAGIIERYHMHPEIEFFTTFAIIDNPGGIVTLPA